MAYVHLQGKTHPLQDIYADPQFHTLEEDDSALVATTTITAKPIIGFFALPRELRDMVYAELWNKTQSLFFDHVMREPSRSIKTVVSATLRQRTTAIPGQQLTGFPRWINVSHRFRAEALQRYYECTQFNLSDIFITRHRYQLGGAYEIVGSQPIRTRWHPTYTLRLQSPFTSCLPSLASAQHVRIGIPAFISPSLEKCPGGYGFARDLLKCFESLESLEINMENTACYFDRWNGFEEASLLKSVPKVLRKFVLKLHNPNPHPGQYISFLNLTFDEWPPAPATAVLAQGEKMSIYNEQHKVKGHRISCYEFAYSPRGSPYASLEEILPGLKKYNPRSQTEMVNDRNSSLRYME